MTADRSDAPSSRLPSPSQALSATARAAINHLLARDANARDRLAAHAGKRVDLALDRGTLRWRVGPDGLLADVPPAEATDAPDLLLTVEAERLREAIATHAPLKRSGARIAGDAELAQTVSWLMEHLRWDAEDDLARWLGDIPARRIARLGRDAVAQARTTWDRMQTDTRDWFAQAPRDLVSRAEMAGLARDTAALRDAAARLDKQLVALRKRLAGEG